jgi:hypothetical protein
MLLLSPRGKAGMGLSADVQRLPYSARHTLSGHSSLQGSKNAIPEIRVAQAMRFAFGRNPVVQHAVPPPFQ